LYDTRDGMRRSWLLAALLVLIALVAFMAPTVLGVPGGEDGQEQPKFRDVRTAIEALYLVKREFYKPVSVSKLLGAYLATGTVQGMLEALEDPYTRYMPPEDYEAMRQESSGVFGGIGILVGIRDDKITVISPLENTPAMRAGLLPGDHIAEIDGVSTEGMVLDRAVSMMKGEPGTEVVLVIERSYPPGRHEVKIIRDIIDAPATRSYMWDPEAGIGYIELRSFSEKAGPDIEAELKKLSAEGLRGLILDLRYNGGGLVNQAVQVASKFIPSGPAMHVQGRDGQRRTTHTVGSKLADVPVVVLVNEYTASASEIVAGAMQDTGVATIVGMPTFGKGLVQTLFTLSDGSGLAVTTQIYLTAGGRAITPENPIQPDVQVEPLTMEELEQLTAAKKSEAAQAGPVTAEDLLRIDPDLDPQFRKAVEILREKIDDEAEAVNVAA